MTSTPFVTVVMTTYNGARFIGESIDSVLSQTFEDFELLVIDDCSTDATVDVIQGYDDPRLRLIRNDRNLGISNTRNVGLTEARGKYVAAHDHDDISLPRRLEREVACLEADPEVVMVAAGGEKFRDGHVVAEPEVGRPPCVLRWKLLTGCPFIHSSVCYRKSTLIDNNIRYRQEFHLAEDYDIFLRLSKLGKIVELEEPLVRYRLHENNNAILRNKEMIGNGRRMLLDEYRLLLGGEINETDIDLIWPTVIEGQPASDREHLFRIGHLLGSLQERFIGNHGLAEDEADAVRRDASQLWWHIVACAAKHHGTELLSAYAQVPALTAITPSRKDVWRTRVLATLGPTVVGAGRRLWSAAGR